MCLVTMICFYLILVEAEGEKGTLRRSGPTKRSVKSLRNGTCWILLGEQKLERQHQRGETLK